jgi:nucleotide-binding universal stress UspA family protein
MRRTVLPGAVPAAGVHAGAVPPATSARTIVVGCDGSSRSLDAVALAELIARPRQARLVLANAYASGGRPDADTLLAQAARRVESTPVDMRAVVARWPARMLHELAEEVGAEVIVVGSTHRGRVGRVLPGSVGRRLLAGSPCAMAIAPLGFAADTRQLDLIGVAYDMTAESEAALTLAAEIATAAGASVRLVMVDEPHTRDFTDQMSGEAHRDRQASRQHLMRRELGRVRDELAVDLRVDVQLRRGLPGPELVKAFGEGVDLCVVGSHSHRPVGRVLAGSVATWVVSGASCPVLVVPRDEGSPPPLGEASRAQAVDVDVVERADDEVGTGTR